MTMTNNSTTEATMNATVTNVNRNFLNSRGLTVMCEPGEIGFDLITVDLDDGGEYTNAANKADSGLINVGDRVAVSAPATSRIGRGNRTISRG